MGASSRGDEVRLTSTNLLSGWNGGACPVRGTALAVIPSDKNSAQRLPALSCASSEASRTYPPDQTSSHAPRSPLRSRTAETPTTAITSLDMRLARDRAGQEI